MFSIYTDLNNSSMIKFGGYDLEAVAPEKPIVLLETVNSTSWALRLESANLSYDAIPFSKAIK